MITPSVPSEPTKRCVSAYPADDFAVCEWTAQAVRDDGRRLEWDGVDVFPIRDGKILRKDVYSGSHAPRLLGTAG